MTKWLIGLFLTVTITTVGLSALYPEQFSMALGFLILGAILGGTVSFALYRATYQLGSQDSQELAKRQIINPASIMREGRLQEKEQVKTQSKKQTGIPRFNTMTGMKDN